MKRQYVSLLAITLTASSFLFSCGDKMNKNTGALVFDSIQVNETAHLFGDTAKPACNLTINFAYPVKSSDEKLKDSLTSFLISACFGEGYIGDKPDAVVKDFTANYTKEYRQDLESMYLEDEKNQEDSEAVGAWYSYYKGIDGHVQLYEKNLLIYRIDYNEYTGGAHGIYMTTYLNMNLLHLHPIRLEDVFIRDYQEALTDLLWNQLMIDHGAKTREELEDMGYGSTGDIAPTENFYLAKDGITFHYNVYDITPYAMGAVEIKLSYDIMAHLLNNDPIVAELRK